MNHFFKIFKKMRRKIIEMDIVERSKSTRLNSKQDGRLAPAKVSRKYKYFDQL